MLDWQGQSETVILSNFLKKRALEIKNLHIAMQVHYRLFMATM
ncbi:hypothetical protein WQG_19580 [Bibersteinia trehalosi USDA-ARS-USMARC-192]|nr:hypothetical protein WQG_19580 [Bibersteinia trehalosi USDA-ARS-USMARC-192]